MTESKSPDESEAGAGVGETVLVTVGSGVIVTGEEVIISLGVSAAVGVGVTGAGIFEGTLTDCVFARAR